MVSVLELAIRGRVLVHKKATSMDNADGYTGKLQSQLDRLRAGDKIAKEEIINHSCERLRQLTRSMLKGYPKLRR